MYMDLAKHENIYRLAFEPEAWEKYFSSFSSNEHAYNTDIKKLRTYINNRCYLEVLDEYETSGSFPTPELLMLNKKGTSKKRMVFSFDEKSSWLLKFFGFFLHAYDDIFSDNLYSFRKERSVKTAIGRLLKQKNITAMHGIKLDIHDYFNSADTEIILDKLKDVLKGQPELLSLIENILKNPEFTEREPQADKHSETVHKGIMAGSPLSPFLANLYLDELDKHFDHIPGFYARYSDDILFLTENEETLKKETEYIHEVLSDKALTLNPEKQSSINPGEAFEFLGFSFINETVDVSKASYEKIKKKLRRKARAVYRWKLKKQVETDKSIRVFIRYFNRKFFENPVKSELTWCRWYFPVITTDTTLREIDHYMQECIRFLYTGKHSKRNYNLRYEDIKKFGYRSLVNEYHKTPV